MSLLSSQYSSGSLFQCKIHSETLFYSWNLIPSPTSQPHTGFSHIEGGLSHRQTLCPLCLCLYSPCPQLECSPLHLQAERLSLCSVTDLDLLTASTLSWSTCLTISPKHVSPWKTRASRGLTCVFPRAQHTQLGSGGCS